MDEHLKVYYEDQGKIATITKSELRTKTKDDLLKLSKQMGMRIIYAKEYSKAELLEMIEDKLNENYEKIQEKIKSNPILSRFENPILSPEHLLLKWSEFIEEKASEVLEVTLENENVIKTNYTIPKVLEFITKNGISKKRWERYKQDEEFKEIIEYMEQEEEVLTLNSFESGNVKPNLAALMLSKFGFSTKTEQKTEADVTIKPAPKFHSIMEQIYNDKK